jgi:hypothetical protein
MMFELRASSLLAALYHLSHTPIPFGVEPSGFCLSWPETAILLPMASCVAETIGLHHNTPSLLIEIWSH